MAAVTPQLEHDYWRILGDPSAEERERIAALNETHLSWRLEKLVGALGDDVEAGPVCTGFYVSSFFHAAATPVESGTVILVSDQLFDVVLGVSILVAASAPWAFGGEETPPDVPEDEADRLIRKIVESSVVGTAPVSIDMYDLAPPRYTGMSMLLGTLLNFVLAHELAHVALGHLRQRGRSGLAKRIDLSTWRTEFAADEYGFRTAAAAFPRVATEPQYMGPVLLFEIVDLAGELLEEANPAGAADIENYGLLVAHPSAAARLSGLINGTLPDGGSVELPLVDDLVARMRRIHGATERHVSDEDFERLRSLAVRCDVERYNAMFAMDEAVEGVTEWHAGAVIELVEGDHDQAQAAIAFAALMRIVLGPTKDHAFRLHLGFMNTLYRIRYVDAPSEHARQAARFQNLLNACIHDLADAEFDVARELHGQRGGS